ncbi:MAG: DNA starvation/stationary phase protection protein Dps [Planctomycetota bacterium]|nr:DNA starvation/stationary phase protection protein Dps [Planctomycetota bacterium]
MKSVHNDLPAATRTAMIKLCNARLADALDLALQVKHAHWNLKGKQFIALHELFDEIYDRVNEGVDTIAERAVQLGGEAEGLAKNVVKGTSLPAYPHGIAPGLDHVAALANALSACAKGCRAAIDAAAGKGDAVTSDMFTAITAGLDKDVWFLEAHLN